jgi:hypothetical protein
MSDAPDHDGNRTKLLRAYQDIFGGHPAGRIVLFDLLSACGLLRCSHEAGCSDATAYNEGQRSIALHIVQQLRWSEGDLLRLAMLRDGAAVDPLQTELEDL